MAVQFQKGGYYLYFDVRLEDFVKVITDSESQGGAFHCHIKKGGYTWRQTTPEEIARL